MIRALRTLVSPWVAIVCSGLIVLNNIQRWGIYEGEFLWAVDMQAIAIFLVGPILTAAVAVDAARLSQPGNRHLLLIRPRVYRQYWYLIAWNLAIVLTAYFGSLFAIALSTVVQAGFLSQWQSTLLQIVCHISWLFFYCCLGTLIGRFFSPLLAGLLGVIFGMAILNAQATLNPDGFSLMQIGGATFSRLGNQYNPAYLGWQILLFGVLGVIALLLPVRTHGQHLRPSTSGYFMIAGILAVLFIPLPGLPADRWVPDSQQPTDCVTGTVEICTYAEHPRFQELVRTRIEQIEAGAEKGGFTFALPARVMQFSHGYIPTPSTDPLLLSLFHDSQEMDIGSFVSVLYHADHCPARLSEYSSPWLDNYFVELQSFAYTVDHYATGYWDSSIELLDPDGVQEFMDRYVACDFD